MSIRGLLSWVAIAAVTLLPPLSLGAEDAPLPPPLRTLPAETIGVMHAPSLNAFIGALRKSTKLGELWFRKERVDRALKLWENKQPAEYAKIIEEMAKDGFKIEDAYSVLDGPAGFAIALVKREGSEPAPIAYFWAEPAGDIAERVFKLMDKEAEEGKDQPERARLEHVDMHGLKVYHWIEPQFRQVSDPKYDRPPPDFFQWPQEQREQWYKERTKAREQTMKVEVDRTYTWVTRVGKRILLVSTIPHNAGKVMEMLAQPEAKVDFAALTGVEQAGRMAAEFFARNLAKDDSKTAVTPWFAAGDLQSSLPAGIPAYEMFMNMRQVLDLVTTLSGAAAAQEATKKWQAASGLDSVGAVGFRVTLDGSVVRMGAIVQAPAPRAGLVSFLDVEPIAPEPPPWANANAVGYGHMVLDLEKIYTSIRAFVVSSFGESSASGFRMFETQAMGVLQVEFPVFLASLGSQIRTVAFQAQKPAEPAPGEAVDPLNTFNPYGTRAAIVWQLRNEEVLQKVMKIVQGFAANTGGMMKPAEEQGFTGVRVEVPGSTTGPIGWFVGRGSMVIAVGGGASEEILAALRAPSETASSLATAPWFVRAKELLELKPSLLLSASDFDAQIVATYEAFWLAFEAAAAEASRDPAAQAILGQVKEVFPTAKEMEKTVGSGVFQVRATTQGLLLEGATELMPLIAK